jgi:vacuolar-type H+-ATPase subunit E/Vma4
MKEFGSAESVLAAIQEDARAEIERIEADCAAAIARLRADAAAVPLVVPDAETRTAAERRRARELAAQEDWADRQAALEARERWIARVAAAGLARLQAVDAATRRDELVRLGREAIAHLRGPEIRLAVAPPDLALAADPTFIADLGAPADTDVKVEASETIEAGCVARTADGRLSFDNTYRARIRRFESAWRQSIIEVLEQPQPMKKVS